MALAVSSLRRLLRQAWFLPLWLLPQLIPPYTARGYPLAAWGTVNAYILTHPIKVNLAGVYPFFQVIPLAFALALLLTGKQLWRLFSAYVALSYAAVAGLQSISISASYGLAICTANLVTFLGLAGLWLAAALFPSKDPAPPPAPAWKTPVTVLAFGLALLAFWCPVHPATLRPDFNLHYLLTSGSGLSFCLSTPLYLALLIHFSPRLSRPVFLATAWIGLYMGLGNLLLEFVLYPVMAWVGVLHFPLIILSAVCLVLAWIEITRPAVPTPEPAPPASLRGSAPL